MSSSGPVGAGTALSRQMSGKLSAFLFDVSSVKPEEEWLCLRTTNVIERVNKEFKRRTKPMEILAGERSCYTLLAFVCLKMELHWRSKLHRKGRAELAFHKKSGK